ncbi:MAG: GTP-binding protein [Lachnospiraceae bacterium]|nr:GTP-binding protein [Lachnospiraceae bacterium]
MTKIDIISGFLGAGKTTFIKKMLEDVFQGEKIVLIENEFGEVGIDGGFLKEAGIEISEMNSGCICCSLVGDFGRNLREVQERFHPDRILIEPSGVGKLSDVMKSVTDLEGEQDVKLNGLITVVNTLKATKQMKAFGEFFNNQIAYATVIVLSRTQKATPEQLEIVVKEVQEKNPKAAIITTPWDEIDGKQIYKLIDERKSLQDELMEEAKRHGRHHEDHGHDHECCHDEHEHCCHEDHGHDHGCCHDEHEHHGHEDHEHEHCGHGNHGHDHEHEHCCHDEHENHGHGHEHGHHHEHGEGCTCGCHDHEHHHDHHADEVFTSWGVETPHKFTRETIEHAMSVFCGGEEYGMILRSKGMVPAEDGSWIYFDMVDGEYELRTGEPDYTGRIVVIGTDLEEGRLKELFGIA